MVRGDLRIDLRKDQNLEGGSLDRLLKKEDLALRREGFGFAVELLSELHLMDKGTRNPGWERMWWEKFGGDTSTSNR